MREIFLSCLLVLAAAGSCPADDKTGTYEVIYEVFSLSQIEAAKLNRQKLGDKKTYEELIQRTDQGSTRLVKWSALTMMEGRSASTEEIEEHIYPAEYQWEGWSLPLAAEGSDGTGGLANFKPPPIPLPLTFAAFDTKNIGDTFEYELHVSGEVAELRFTITHISYIGIDLYGQGVSEWPMPRFSVQSINNGVTTKLGIPALAGSISPPKKLNLEGANEKIIWLAFITINKTNSP